MLPAYAGMILRNSSQIRHDFRAPRVCGDDPDIAELIDTAVTCSPRMRG